MYYMYVPQVYDLLMPLVSAVTCPFRSLKVEALQTSSHSFPILHYAPFVDELIVRLIAEDKPRE